MLFSHSLLRMGKAIWSCSPLTACSPLLLSYHSLLQIGKAIGALLGGASARPKCQLRWVRPLGLAPLYSRGPGSLALTAEGPGGSGILQAHVGMPSYSRPSHIGMLSHMGGPTYIGMPSHSGGPWGLALLARLWDLALLSHPRALGSCSLLASILLSSHIHLALLSPPFCSPLTSKALGSCSPLTSQSPCSH